MSPKSLAGFLLPIGFCVPAPRPDPPIDIPLAITNVVQYEDVEAARTGLLALRHDLYQCASCDHSQTRAGSCPKCDADLARAREEAPVLTSVQVDPTAGIARLTLAKGHTLALSEVDHALAQTRIRIARERLELTAWSKLVLSGVGSEDDANAIEEELVDAGLFRSVDLTYDPAAKVAELIVKKTAKEPQSLARVASVVVTGGFRVADLVFTYPCAKCAQKGASPGCPGCWTAQGP
jgi:hypothetical protein